MGIPGIRSPLRWVCHPGVVDMSGGGHVWKAVYAQEVGTTPWTYPLTTTDTGDYHTYSQQAGITHSYWSDFLFRIFIHPIVEVNMKMWSWLILDNFSMMFATPSCCEVTESQIF